MVSHAQLLLLARCLLPLCLLPSCRTMVFGAFPRLNRKNNSELPKRLEYRAGGDQCDGRHELDLSSCHIFNTLEPSDLDRVVNSLEIVQVDEGEVIIEQDAEDNEMYFVGEGALECYQEKKPSKVVKELKSGDLFGELALFLGTPRALSVRAATKATVWKLTKDAFDEATQDTEIADEEILGLLKRAYKDEKIWVTLPKITFHHGRTTASWEKPHPHEGKLRPFEPTGIHLTKNLDTAGLDTLHRGKPYKMSTDAYGEKRAVVVQDIDAPTDVVLNRILDYDHYHKMVPQTLQSEIYKKASNETSNTENYFARLKTGMRGFSMEFFVKATHHPAHNSITWRLDYEKESEIDDACGHWYVEPHASSPDTKSRLFYSVDMILGPNVATCVANFINKKAATDATAWVKKFSEKHS